MFFPLTPGLPSRRDCYCGQLVAGVFWRVLVCIVLWGPGKPQALCCTVGGSGNGALRSSLWAWILVCLGHFSICVQVHVWSIHSPFEEQLRLFPATFTVCKSILRISFYVFLCAWQLHLCGTFLLRGILAGSSFLSKHEGAINLHSRKAVLVDHSLNLPLPSLFLNFVICLCEK